MDDLHPCRDPDAPTGGPCSCADLPADPSAVPADRNRYFTGKYMTARDFLAEQAYFLSRHRLHQRTLHGWGIVCGLDVVPHPDPECRRRAWVVITPGIASDCYGREVVVRVPLPVRLPDVYPAEVECGDEERYRTPTGGKDAGPQDPPPAKEWFLLGLRYGERCVEPVPVLADTTGCEPRTAPNRVREVTCPRYLRMKDGAGCWGLPPRPPGPCPAPVAPTVKEIPASLDDVLRPLCDAGCKGFVPLARCQYVKDGGGTMLIPVGAEEDPSKYIDPEGRRYLPGPFDPRHLTHICDVNWRHGGETSLDELITGQGQPAQAQQQGGKDYRLVTLYIQFDRPLSRRLPTREGRDLIEYDTSVPSEEQVGHEIGFYKRILRLRFEDNLGTWTALPWLWDGEATLVGSRTRLEYTFPVWALLEAIRNNERPIIRVTLDCDFLTDGWGRAVDGDHLHGLLAKRPSGRKEERPKGISGDGVEGGLFESWFRLTGLKGRKETST